MPVTPATARDPGDADARAVNRLWKLQGYGGIATRAVGSFLPGFQGTITVACAGGPEADMRRIWYLACAAVFGRYRNCPKTQFQQIEFSSSWDLSMKTVTVALSYRLNPMAELVLSAGLPTIIGAAVGGGFTDKLVVVGGCAVLGTLVTAFAGASTTEKGPASDPWAYLHRGPEQLTIGDSWPDACGGANPIDAAAVGDADWVLIALKPQTEQKIAVLPVEWRNHYNVYREFPFMQGPYAKSYPYGFCTPSATSILGTVMTGESGRKGTANLVGSKIPALPDAGRVIMTVEKRDIRVQPPRPPLDGATRGSLVELVFQALNDPCYLPSAPPGDGTILAGAGVYTYKGYGKKSLEDLGAAVAAGGQTGNIYLGPTGPTGTGPRGIGDMKANYYSFEK